MREHNEMNETDRFINNKNKLSKQSSLKDP